MSLRVLADENVDHQVVYRLAHYGHDIEHVDFVSALGKGSSDETIARYSRQEDRHILTNDDDFLTDFTGDEYHGLFFITDETLAGTEIAEIVHTISELVPSERPTNTILYVSSNWL